ncbi:MAG: hypothetical protein ACR2IF_15060 [Terriglobales bacterium]
MTFSRHAQIWACVMVIVFPLSAMAADMQGAILYMNNAAKVNGMMVNHSTVIFSGDKVQLTNDLPASLTMSGTVVTVAPGSTLIYRTNALELSNISGVVVSTSNGTAVRVNRVTIAPASGKGKFQVARAGGKVLIAAKSGAVSIFDGASTRTVAEGNSTTVADPTPADQPGAVPGASGGGSAGTVAGVVAGIAAAAVGALTAYVSTGSGNLQPISIRVP